MVVLKHFGFYYGYNAMCDCRYSFKIGLIANLPVRPYERRYKFNFGMALDWVETYSIPGFVNSASWTGRNGHWKIW